MKNVITIIVFSLLFFSCRSQRYFYHLIHRGVTSRNVSDIKNIQPIPDSLYEAFGFTVQNKVNQVTLYTNNATSHTVGAYPIYRTFNIAARVWSDSVIISAPDSIYTATTSGGQMDNDSSVLFIVKNHTDIYHSRDIYIQKCDTNNHFSAPVLFNWTGITQLQSGFFFGPLIHGDAAGESYATMYQVNGDTGTTRYRISIFKTTDYWTHYIEKGVIYDSTLDYSETAGVNLGSGKFLALSRKNNAGSLTPFESTDFGATWTRRPASNLTWYAGGLPEIPWIYVNETKDSFIVFYENRDASMMYISKGNTVANFGSGGPYNESEIYSYHRGTGGNPSLGYGSMIKLAPLNKFLMTYFKEYTTTKANPQWTIDDLVTDPAGIPSAPAFSTGSITTTSFIVTITGQTDTTWQNIRYFLIDLSTHADFSDFVTAKYRAVSAFSASVIHDTRALAGFVNFSALTTGTTYYFRIKACNNAGCSAYTTTNVTTL